MKLRILLFLVLVLSFSVFAKRMKWAQPKEKAVQVYQDRSGEKSYIIGLDVRLRVVGKKGDFYHVYHNDKYGWVKKRRWFY